MSGYKEGACRYVDVSLARQDEDEREKYSEANDYDEENKEQGREKD